MASCQRHYDYTRPPGPGDWPVSMASKCARQKAIASRPSSSGSRSLNGPSLIKKSIVVRAYPIPPWAPATTGENSNHPVGIRTFMFTADRIGQHPLTNLRIRGRFIDIVKDVSDCAEQRYQSDPTRPLIVRVGARLEIGQRVFTIAEYFASLFCHARIVPVSLKPSAGLYLSVAGRAILTVMALMHQTQLDLDRCRHLFGRPADAGVPRPLRHLLHTFPLR